MRLIGFSKIASKAVLYVDNKENISKVFNGNVKWIADKQNYEEYSGPMPFFVMHFTTNFRIHSTASSSCIELIEKDTNNKYELYSDGLTMFFNLLDTNRIYKDEDGFFIGVFTVCKAGSVIFLSLVDPDNVVIDFI